jgi:hypothetical protein
VCGLGIEERFFGVFLEIMGKGILFEKLSHKSVFFLIYLLFLSKLEQYEASFDPIQSHF